MEKEFKKFLNDKKIVDIGDNDIEYRYRIDSLSNWSERDIVYELLDFIEMTYNISIEKFSVEYIVKTNVITVERYKEN